VRGLDLSITHNFPGLGEDFPGGGDVVETLEAAPQDDHSGFAVVFAAEEAVQARVASQPGCGFSSCALMAQSAISSLWPRYLIWCAGGPKRTAANRIASVTVRVLCPGRRGTVTLMRAATGCICRWEKRTVGIVHEPAVVLAAQEQFVPRRALLFAPRAPAGAGGKVRRRLLK